MADAASSLAECDQRDRRGDNTVALIALDGSEHSFYALDWYVNNIRKPGSKVIVVYCSDYSDVIWAPVMSTDSAAISNMVRLCEDTTNNVVTKIQQKLATVKCLNRPDYFLHIAKEKRPLAAFLIPPIYKVDSQLLRLSGDPGPAIIKAADEHKVNCIVTGTRGLGKVRRTLLGSVSSYIVHHSHCPVLVCTFKSQ